nr:immunoglobulin light chain junction region [Macaca mulatta]
DYYCLLYCSGVHLF